MLCGITYLYQALELKNWEVPIGMVDGVRIQFLFLIIVEILYCLTCVYTQEFLRIKFKTYVPKLLIYNFENQCLKRIAKLPSIRFDNKLKSDLAMLTNNSKLLRRGFTKTILTIIVQSLIFFFPFYTLSFTQVLNTGFKSTIVLFLVTVLVIIIIEFFGCRFEVSKEIRKLKRMIRERKDDDTLSYLKAYRELSDNTLRRITTQEETTNPIKSMNHTTTLIIAILMFMVYMLLNLYSTTKKEYWIYQDDSGSNYASVIEMGDSAILKRIEIDGDNAIIYLNDQLQLKTTNVKLKYYKFTEVTIER